MARFQLTSGSVLGHKNYKTGTTVADSVANAIGNDVVWTPMSSTTIGPQFNPLDASAIAMKNASRFANTPAPPTDGRAGIEG